MAGSLHKKQKQTKQKFVSSYPRDWWQKNKNTIKDDGGNVIKESIQRTVGSWSLKFLRDQLITGPLVDPVVTALWSPVISGIVKNPRYDCTRDYRAIRWGACLTSASSHLFRGLACETGRAPLIFILLFTLSPRFYSPLSIQTNTNLSLEELYNTYHYRYNHQHSS